MNRMQQIGKKTVVVLLGWLGAQPKSLRRYETLYRTLLGRDCDVCCGSGDEPTTTAVIQTYVAPPFTIVKSVLETSIDEPIRIPFEWPQVPPSKSRDDVRSVQELAWIVLQDIHDHIHCDTTTSDHYNHHNSYIYIHAFSNGGCFVWEKISQILVSLEPLVEDEKRETHSERTDRISSDSSSAMTNVQRRILLFIRQQLRGVVFDSCPIGDLHRLPEALQYCTIWERMQVLRYCHYNYLSINSDPKVTKQVQDRIATYISRLQNDPLNVKQLYLYSRDDPLAPSIFIDELIQHRRHRLHQLQNANIVDVKNGDDKMIVSCVWEKSQHCGHYIHHPKDYTKAIETLLSIYKRNDKNNNNNNNSSKDYQRNILRSKL